MSSAETAVGAGQASPDKAAAAPLFSKSYRVWMLFILLLINVMNLMDRQGMAAIGPAMKADLKLGDSELGFLQGMGFALFHTLLGLPVARLAERWSRSKMVSISALVFGAVTMFCGVAQNVWQMSVGRAGAGIGDLGFGTPVNSLIGDHYPKEKRASAMTILWLGAPIGAVTGAVAAGWISEFGSWRTWFYILGGASMLVGLLAMLTLREPPRGMSDERAPTGPPPSMWEVAKFLWGKKSMRWLLVGVGIAAMSMNALGQFWARFFVSNFDMGPAQAGRILGLMAGASMASGLALGGFGMDWMSTRFDRRWYVWGPAIGLALATPLFYFGAQLHSIPLLLAVLIAGHVALFVYYTPSLALAQNMVGAEMRATSAFVVITVIGLLGTGMGPTVVGVLSDVMAQQAFPLGHFRAACPGGAAPAGAAAELVGACKTASATGIRNAIVFMSLFFALAAVAYAMAGRHLRQDLDTHYQPRPTA
jgi:MFS family permease